MQAFTVLEACVESASVGCTSFLGDGAAALVPSSGEEPAPPRRRAGVASMAWRSTRRLRTPLETLLDLRQQHLPVLLVEDLSDISYSFVGVDRDRKGPDAIILYFEFIESLPH